MTKRSRFQAMSLTDSAADRIRAIMAKSTEPTVGLRVGVKNGGCAGMSYTMELARAVDPHDEVVEDKGVKLLIDPKAVLFLLGSQLDFRTDDLSSTFVFGNPNETSACGCGESVAITPAKPEALEAAPRVSLDAAAIKELFAPFKPVAVKRMFGGAGVYWDGLCFAIEGEGEIYLKVDGENRDAFVAAGSRPFVYVMKGKPMEMGYWRLIDAAMDDPDELRRWAKLGFDAARRAAEAKAAKAGAKAARAKARPTR